MNSILDFYLATVLPAAIAGVSGDTKDLKPYVESIQLIFDELKRDVTQCVSTAAHKHRCIFYASSAYYFFFSSENQ